MGLFGWSLPPGCGTLPGEEPEGPCEVCGGYGDSIKEPCICPECPVCGCNGSLQCYVSHGLSLNHNQIAAKERRDVEQATAIGAEEAFWRDYQGETDLPDA